MFAKIAQDRTDGVVRGIGSMLFAQRARIGAAALKHRHAAAAKHDLDEQAKKLATLEGLNVRGVMTMAPLGADEAELRRTFAGAHEALAETGYCLTAGFLSDPAD